MRARSPSSVAIPAFVALPLAATALLVIAAVAIGTGLHLSGVLVLVSLVVIATGLMSQFAAVLAVAVIAWMTSNAFVAPPYLDLRLTGHAPLGNAFVISLSTLVGAVSGITRRRLAQRAAFRRAYHSLLTEADTAAHHAPGTGSGADDHAA